MQHNKVAIITGASRGIGAQTALLFAQHGYAVCINYLVNIKAAEQVQQQIIQQGGQCLCVQADVSQESEVTKLFNTVKQTFGTVSVLVNNVGILKRQARFSDISPSRFSEIINTNVLSCVLTSQAAIKQMSTKLGGEGGTIVNVSSLAAKTGSPNEYIDYAASKGAIDTITRGLAIELAEEGIRVNGVRPGLIDTDIHANGGEPKRVERLKAKLPLQRAGQASEIAEAIFWLASEKSSFVTGSFIDVAGGLS